MKAEKAHNKFWNQNNSSQDPPIHASNTTTVHALISYIISGLNYNTWDDYIPEKLNGLSNPVEILLGNTTNVLSQFKGMVTISFQGFSGVIEALFALHIRFSLISINKLANYCLIDFNQYGCTITSSNNTSSSSLPPGPNSVHTLPLPKTELDNSSSKILRNIHASGLQPSSYNQTNLETSGQERDKISTIYGTVDLDIYTKLKFSPCFSYQSYSKATVLNTTSAKSSFRQNRKECSFANQLLKLHGLLN
ncbi:hypothetical protein HOY82DRAFT_607523 [Tuber indicum]|nr:hypothetical protein HOY82DRAFT_607523 [Tuber indicum]